MTNENDFSDLSTCLFGLYVNSVENDDEFDADELLNLAIKNLSNYFLKNRYFYDGILKLKKFDLDLVKEFKDAFEKLEEILIEIYNSYFLSYIKFVNVKYNQEIKNIIRLFNKIQFDIRVMLNRFGILADIQPSDTLPSSTELIELSYDCYLMGHFFKTICQFKEKHDNFDVQVLVEYLISPNSKDLLWNEENFIKNSTLKEQEIYKKSTNTKILTNLQWQCELCTFLNDSDQSFCAICKVHKTNSALFNI